MTGWLAFTGHRSLAIGHYSLPSCDHQATGRDCTLSTTFSVNRRGSAVAAARRAGYPWTEQMARKMLRNVEKRGVQAARNGPSEDSKCWQRIELGIHGVKS
jgi:hypothetical protein